MRIGLWTFVAAFFGIIATGSSGYNCPPGCYCDDKRASHVPGGVGVKISCHPLKSGTLEDFASLPNTTVQLDLAKYGLKFVS